METFSSIASIVSGVFEHEGFMAAYGVIAWNGLHYALDKKKAGTKNLTFVKWKKSHSTDILIMVIVALGMVIFDDEIVDGYNSFVEKDIELQRWFYLLPGIVTGRILKWMYKEETKIV